VSTVVSYYSVNMTFQFTTTASIMVDAKLYLRQWEICSHVPRPSGYASEAIINLILGLV